MSLLLRACIIIGFVLVANGCVIHHKSRSTSPVFEPGMISVLSQHSVADTITNLERALNDKGMQVFARINHSQGAESVGMQLRPTELLIFGNPKVGAPLMQCEQTVALDLPQKALAWQDQNGRVWLSYNAPAYLAKRHELQSCEQVLAKVEAALANFAKAATE